MEEINGEAWSVLFVFVPLMFIGVAAVVSHSWVQHRSRSKALDVLQTYAERGEEPPASVLDAVSKATSHFNMGARPATSRAGHLPHLAFSVVAAAGATWLAWWRMPEDGVPDAIVIVAIIAALLFAAGAAYRLTAALSGPGNEG